LIENIDSAQHSFTMLAQGIRVQLVSYFFRAMVDLGCITSVERGKARQLAGQDIDTFDLEWLQACAMCNRAATQIFQQPMLLLNLKLMKTRVTCPFRQ
jgi:predicted TPR repeat methyltransferase